MSKSSIIDLIYSHKLRWGPSDSEPVLPNNTEWAQAKRFFLFSQYTTLVWYIVCLLWLLIHTKISYMQLITNNCMWFTKKKTIACELRIINLLIFLYQLRPINIILFFWEKNILWNKKFDKLYDIKPVTFR